MLVLTTQTDMSY